MGSVGSDTLDGRLGVPLFSGWLVGVLRTTLVRSLFIDQSHKCYRHSYVVSPSLVLGFANRCNKLNNNKRRINNQANNRMCDFSKMSTGKNACINNN